MLFPRPQADIFAGRLRAIPRRAARAARRMLLAKRAEHIALARDIAREALTSSRPPDGMEAAEWEEYAARFAATISTRISPLVETGDNIVGHLLVFGGVRGAEENSPNGVITRADVLAWVTAGMQGDPAGKIIEGWSGGRDFGRDPGEIADRLMFHLARTPGAPLEGPLREWLDGDGNFTFSPYLRAVIEAWRRLLAPQVWSDIRAAAAVAHRTP